jgi:DNA-binding CsgD family transcriptional regulator
VQHRRRPDRPAFGWGSLTDTEERIVDLVAQGLSNRKVADQMFLSAHTIAFHLRHVYWKLDITSRVQLAALVAERAAESGGVLSPAMAGLAAGGCWFMRPAA